MIAGQTRAFYDCTDKFGALEREANIIADLPAQYGKPEEFKYYKNCYPKPDITAVTRDDLIKTIRKCHQTLWGGGRLSPPMAFGELTKLIFLKTRDEKMPRKKCEPYAFQIKTNETPQRLTARIKALYAIERQKEPDVFNEDIKIDEITLRNVVLHLEGLNLTATDLDTKGVAFEQFMDGFFKGDFGQYFTPRNIIAFAIQMLDIKANDTVIDPACGSGGFLLHALDHVRKLAGEYYDEDSKEHFDYWHNRIDHLAPVTTTQGLGYHYHLGRTQAVDAASLVSVFESILTARHREIFISMAFIPETLETFETIKKTVRQINEKHKLDIHLREIRIDQFNKGHTYTIDDEILTVIEGSGLLIADLTFGNRNVYHEIGYLMGLNRGKGLEQDNFILIADKKTRGDELEKDIGFNLKSWQQLRFESTRQLEEGLTESLETYYQLNGAK